MLMTKHLNIQMVFVLRFCWLVPQ